jgi:replication factor C subunit 1
VNSYNQMSHPVPFMKASNVLAPKKMAKEVPDLEEAIEEEDDADVVEAPEVDDDEDMDIKGDKYIKQPKPKAAGKKGGKKATAKGADAGDDEDAPQPAKAKAKGTGRPAKK